MENLRDCWETPPEVFSAINKFFNGRLMLDVCASASNSKCPYFFDREKDGLQRSWDYRATGLSMWFCNPPFSEIEKWSIKASMESSSGAPGVMLVPANQTEREWFHRLPVGKIDVLFLRRRIKFVPPPSISASSPRFGCMLLRFYSEGNGGKFEILDLADWT